MVEDALTLGERKQLPFPCNPRVTYGLWGSQTWESEKLGKPVAFIVVFFPGRKGTSASLLLSLKGDEAGREGESGGCEEGKRCPGVLI